MGCVPLCLECTLRRSTQPLIGINDVDDGTTAQGREQSATTTISGDRTALTNGTYNENPILPLTTRHRRTILVTHAMAVRV